MTLVPAKLFDTCSWSLFCFHTNKPMTNVSPQDSVVIVLKVLNVMCPPTTVL